jgi:hypothetical protein
LGIDRPTGEEGDVDRAPAQEGVRVRTEEGWRFR